MQKTLLTFLLLNFILLTFTSCGYKPTSYYAKTEISGKVYVKLNIDISNAINSVMVKDAVNEMVVNQFGASLTNNKEIADTIVNVSLGSVSFTTLQSDSQGYAKLYRTSVKVSLSYLNKREDDNKTKSISVSGSYDYSVDSDSIITDAKKQESVKIAAQKALSDIFSNIAVQSFKKREKKIFIQEKEDEVDEEQQNKSKSYFFFN